MMFGNGISCVLEKQIDFGNGRQPWEIMYKPKFRFY